MKSELHTLFIGVLIVAVASLVSRQLPPTGTRHDDSSVAEVERLREHFRTVEAELLTRDISRLNAKQRAARARHIRVLRAYSAAGIFPHNHTQAKRTPFFRDEHGTLCALGYLMVESGETDLVDRIARTNNHAYIRDLAHDPALLIWLEQNGLTVAEAARIQPKYGNFPVEDKSEAAEAQVGSRSRSQPWQPILDPQLSGRMRAGVNLRF